MLLADVCPRLIQNMFLTHCPARPHQDLAHFKARLQRVLLVGRGVGGSVFEVPQELIQNLLREDVGQRDQTWTRR